MTAKNNDNVIIITFLWQMSQSIWFLPRIHHKDHLRLISSQRV